MVRVEIWKSDQNATEVHLFLKTGIGRETYLCGYNPAYIRLSEIPNLFRSDEIAEEVNKALWQSKIMR